MMFYFIGKLIRDSSLASLVYIIVGSIYGAFILAAWVRLVYQYHKGTLESPAYETPIHLYTVLAPTSLIGLMLVQSSVYLIIVYCSPLALLLLILLLNHNMKIITFSNFVFFITEIVMIGLTVGFILLGDQAKTYLLLVTMFVSIIGVFSEAWLLYYGGVNLSLGKVYPSRDTESELPEPKKIHATNQEEK